jgi:hypothetical protein
MSIYQLGCFVTHQKMPELGAGEVVSSDKGALRIRFAGGERSFSEEIAHQHLTITMEGPPPEAPKKAKRKAAVRKPKAAAAKAAS